MSVNAGDLIFSCDDDLKDIMKGLIGPTVFISKRVDRGPRRRNPQRTDENSSAEL